jgi:hypothetical protein
VRTTLDLPTELLKRAKIAAVERGLTLGELVGAALIRDLAANQAPVERRIRFPVFSSSQPGSLELTNADLARAELDENLGGPGLPSPAQEGTTFSPSIKASASSTGSKPRS